MARDGKRSVVSPRMAGVALLAMLPLALGIFIGVEVGQGAAADQRQIIQSCLPLASPSHLATCLDGGR